MVTWQCLAAIVALIGSVYCAYRDRSILAACVALLAICIASACIR